MIFEEANFFNKMVVCKREECFKNNLIWEN